MDLLVSGVGFLATDDEIEGVCCGGVGGVREDFETADVSGVICYHEDVGWVG